MTSHDIKQRAKEDADRRAKEEKEALAAELDAMRKELQAAREALNPPSKLKVVSPPENEVADVPIQEQAPEELPLSPLDAIAAKYKLAKWQFPALEEAWNLGVSFGQWVPQDPEKSA